MANGMFTHHINDLLECQTKEELQGFWLVVDRPLQRIVMLQKVVEQSSFIGASQDI